MTRAGSGAPLLLAATPSGWVELALERWRELLVDHANCEKKAASTALALLFAYPEDTGLCLALSRLAREELHHFERVARLMRAQAIPFTRLAPSRYASRLRAALSRDEPRRKLDLLLCGALIEARSCERFGLLAARLPEAVGGLYAELEASEARHHELYLALASRAAQTGELAQSDLERRLHELALLEAELASGPDPEFRFHSGSPVSALARA